MEIPQMVAIFCTAFALFKWWRLNRKYENQVKLTETMADIIRKQEVRIDELSDALGKCECIQ